MRWTCPDPDCPPIDTAPARVTTPDDDVEVAVCAGCNGTFPASAFNQVADG